MCDPTEFGHDIDFTKKRGSEHDTIPSKWVTDYQAVAAARSGKLLEAARLIRERANAIRHDRGSHWYPGTYGIHSSAGRVADTVGTATAAHIASWDPGAALAIAEWLETQAEVASWEVFGTRNALTFARVFLGEGNA